MIALAVAAVAVAWLLTVPLVGLIHGLRHPRDPQAGMAGIYFFFLSTPRWVLMALALAVATKHGAMAWLADDPRVQWLAVWFGHLLAGPASLAAQLGASSRGSDRKIAPKAAFVAAVLFPAMTGGFALVGVLAGPTPARDVTLAVLAWAIVGLTSAVGLSLLVGWLADAPERAAHARQREADERARRETYYRERLEQLNAIPPDAPVYKWIQFTYCNEPGDVAERARAMVLARPTLTTDLGDALRGNACYEGMWFVATGMTPPLPPELAAPVRDGIVRIGEHIRGQLSVEVQHWPDQHLGETERILRVVDSFGVGDVDFAAALRVLREALAVPAAKGAERTACDRIDRWLEAHTPAKATVGTRE